MRRIEHERREQGELAPLSTATGLMHRAISRRALARGSFWLLLLFAFSHEYELVFMVICTDSLWYIRSIPVEAFGRDTTSQIAQVLARSFYVEAYHRCISRG